MSDENGHVVTVTLMNRPYKIKCEPTEAQALQDAARYLNKQMKSIREVGNVISTDRIAVVAALNMANELVAAKKLYLEYEDTTKQRMRGFQAQARQILVHSEKK